MIIAHHLIWTAYGWWLPNDPRGSSSNVIRSDVIAELGELHSGRKKVQPAGRSISNFYETAARTLVHELLTFTSKEVMALGESLAATIARRRYTCWACAIMPDHVHMVVRKHRDNGDEMIRQFQNDSRLLLRELRFRPPDHPVWGGAGWKVYLDTPYDIRRSIAYVRNNPAKQGSRARTWPFVVTYNNWPFHPGSSPLSPYARDAKGIVKSQANTKTDSQTKV